jgi:hypothetical protein
VKNPPLDARAAAVLAHVRSLTVAAFDEAAGTTSAVDGMTALFGADRCSAIPMVRCDDLSAWDDGCTVVLRFPEPLGGLATFAYDEHSTHYWQNLSMGRRADLAMTFPNITRTFESLPDMCVTLVREVGYVLSGIDEREAANVSLNCWDTAWTLRHALSLLDPRDRAAFEMLAGLSLDPGALRLVEIVLRRAEHLVANLAHEDDIEDVMRAAVIRHNGVELTGKQIQDLSPGEALMGVERAGWDQAADAVVALRYADGLDATYHPAPPAPPRPAPTAVPAAAHGSGYGSLLNVLAV